MGLLTSLRDALTPTHDQAVHYRCLRCDREFVYRADLSEPNCPYCDNEHLERLDQR